MTKDLITISNIEKAAPYIGAEVFKDGRVNIWGFRTAGGEFNDTFCIFTYNGQNVNMLPLIQGTTEPGKSYLKQVLGNANGTAILVHDRQYIDCWVRGKHKGKYDALVQSNRAKFFVWRDANKNGDVDEYGKEWNDVGGLNFHSTKLGYSANWIGNFSAGCQVNFSWDQFAKTTIPYLYSLPQQYFSYTLILDKTFENAIS